MSGMIGTARVGARMSPKQRLAVCQIDSAPLVSDLRNWFEKARLLGRSPRAEAISYPLNHWEGLAVSSGSPARKIASGLTLVAVLLRREISASLSALLMRGPSITGR